MHTRVALSCAGLIAAAFLSAGAGAQTIATVDGSKITQDELNAFAEGRTGARPTEENRTELIEQIGDLYILSNEAIKQGYDKDSDVVAQLELQRRSILAQAAITGFIQKNPTTDEAVRAEYDKEFSDGNRPGQFKARHILVETEDEAKAIIALLDKGGDFEALAKEKSTGPSGPKGGDLGWFAADAMVPEFSAAVVALEDGKYSAAPTKTNFGWHVILREGTRQTDAPAFDDIKDRVRQAMEQRAFQDYFESLRSAAKRETIK